jgi:plastocyanin
MPVAPAIAADSVLVGAGDIHADCLHTGDQATAALISQVPGIVFTLGDNTENGALQEYTDCYAQSWGAFKDRTIPTSGNHDWNIAGATGYFAYFGAAAGEPGTALYSYDVDDAWHVVVLNSECAKIAGGCGVGSPQDLWLRADLEASAGRNVIAMWHKPAFSSEKSGGFKEMRPLFATLHRYGVDLLLTGHRHLYERFAPQTADGIADPAHGVTQFIVGTAGSFFETFTPTPTANSVIRMTGVFGVLKLTLHDDTFDWSFIPIAGQTFTDSGTALVNKGPTAPFADADNQYVLVKADTPVSVTLHAVDLQKDPLTYAVVTAPTHGALSGAEPDLTYTPSAGYLGDDLFTFRANDGAEDSNLVTVWLTVAAQQNVTVQDGAFSPKSLTPAQGATVLWSFIGPSNHTVRNEQSLGLFDSGSKVPGTTFSFDFSAAGTYPYRCSIHPSLETGTIKIPLKVRATAVKGVPFTVTWASALLNGYIYDVQVLLPGETTWKNWQVDTTRLSGDYTPALKGTYKLRARLQWIFNGRTSSWSPVSSVSVN